jgi:hypothetical protein
MSTKTFVSEYFINAIADGYVYQCSCGELYNDIGAANICRKCRNYCVFGYCTHVIDVRNDEVVEGAKPTQSEYKAAELTAKARWAEEKAELELYVQMREKEGPLYEAKMLQQEEAARVVAAEAKLDREWVIHDKMMGR